MGKKSKTMVTCPSCQARISRANLASHLATKHKNKYSKSERKQILSKALGMESAEREQRLQSARRDSQRGTILKIGAIAAIAIVVILILVNLPRTEPGPTAAPNFS